MVSKTNTTHVPPDNIFDQMTSLERLYLEVNNNLNLSMVSNLTSLKKGSSGYNMTALDTKPLKASPGIWYLELIRNQFLRLTRETLIDCSSGNE